MVFRYSVAFVLNLFRMSKKGHLNLADVLALTPIMHRMKGNAKSLTLITVLTAVQASVVSLNVVDFRSGMTFILICPHLRLFLPARGSPSARSRP